jgi:hypothetical protein
MIIKICMYCFQNLCSITGKLFQVYQESYGSITVRITEAYEDFRGNTAAGITATYGRFQISLVLFLRKASKTFPEGIEWFETRRRMV